MEITNQELERLHARLDAIERKLDSRDAPLRELLDEVGPIGKEVMGAATDTLGDMEKKGYFEWGREGAAIVDRIVTNYSPEDVRALGNNIVKILDVVRASTQPEVLEIVAEAAETLKHPEQLEPIGWMGMMRAGRDEDVQRGMAMMFELLRQLGRGARAVSEVKPRRKAIDPKVEKNAKLSAMLAPSRKKEAAPPAACGIERTVAPRKNVVTIPGFEFTVDGFLADPSTWTKQFATDLAAATGAELGEAQWALIDFARKDFLDSGSSPNIRRLSTGTGMSTKDIYALFKTAPGKTIARLAGIPKPAGCI